MYHKKTFTGVYLNWTSLTSRKYKIGLIYGLLDRIWRICSEETDKMEEIEKLKIILQKNEYPKHVVDKEIERFLKNRMNQQQNHPAEKNKEKQTKKRQYIVLPYVNHKAEEFVRRLKKLVTSTFPQDDFNFAFKALNEIGKFFPFKDNVKEVENKSLVV